MIHVIAAIELNPGAREKWLEIFRANMPAVQAENGCIAYNPTVDVETGLSAQGPARANVVTIMEAWAGLAHLQAHLQAPHMCEYRRRVEGLVKSVKLQVLQPV